MSQRVVGRKSVNRRLTVDGLTIADIQPISAELIAGRCRVKKS